MELTCETKITLKELNELINFVDLRKVFNHVQDKHGVPAKDGDIRRWADGKLHQKTAHGWRILPNPKEYELPEHSSGDVNGNPSELKINVFDFYKSLKALEQKNYRDVKNLVRFDNISKEMAYQLGTKNRTSFITKGDICHIRPDRKHEQALRPEEYREIPHVLKNTKKVYVDNKPAHGNFYVTFPDKQDKEKINKVTYEKTKEGNRLISVGKINKRNERTNEKIRLIRGRS